MENDQCQMTNHDQCQMIRPSGSKRRQSLHTKELASRSSNGASGMDLRQMYPIIGGSVQVRVGFYAIARVGRGQGDCLFVVQWFACKSRLNGRGAERFGPDPGYSNGSGFTDSIAANLQRYSNPNHREARGGMRHLLVSLPRGAIGPIDSDFANDFTRMQRSRK